MVGKRIKNFTQEERLGITKDVRQGVKLPKTTYQKIKKELLDKYEIKGFQTLFDYLIVSGIVYLKKDIIEVVRARVPEYTARYRQAKMSYLGLAERPDRGEIVQSVCMMYERDADAFNKFCIEENIKKFWISDILMDEFARENPVVIEHIKACQKLNITERKKQVSRLVGDEYIVILDDRDANELLDILTKRYDNNEYGGTIQLEVQERLRKAEEDAEEEKEGEDAFAAKLARLRRARANNVRALTKPLIDLDLDVDRKQKPATTKKK